MIILRNVKLRRGARLLLEDVNLTIQPGQHHALTGANGCGKSSLFALLTGELAPDAGDIEGLSSMNIAVMAQEVEPVPLAAVDYLVGGDEEIAGIRAAIAQAEATGNFEGAAALHARLEAADGYHIERRAKLMMLGLGFSDGDYSRPVTDFSGGWRIRLALGRALMAPSDLLLLDEPTNHLDLDATLWLEQWLAAYRGTLLLISHDREFIDATCQQVLHIEHGRISSYNGNYTAFEKQRAERLASQQASYDKQQRRIAEIDAFVRRFRYKASKARQAQSRLKELERLQSLAPAHMDSPFHFEFLEPERASDPILQLSDAVMGYTERPVLTAVSLNLSPGDRIGLLGKNGAGKSTLLKSLRGTLPLLDGERVEGAHCCIGYFDQHQLEALDLQASPLTQLSRLRPDAREQDMLNFLGGFGFGHDMATAPVGPLSGGEKTRLALAIVIWQRPNLLVMDEPTNHLDMAMRHALTVALQQYEGALILVTHDRHLFRNTVDSLLLVHRGSVTEYSEDISAYERWVLEQRRSEEQDLETTGRNAGDGLSRRKERQLAAARRSQLRPIKQRIQETERALADIEGRLSWLETRLADSSLYDEGRKPELDELLREEGQLRRQFRQLEEAWLEQNEALEKLEAS